MQMMGRTVGVLALALMQPLKIWAPSVGATLVVCGLLFAYTSGPAWANTITVNSLADDADPNDGVCTLREAITAANTDTSSGMATGECAAGSGDDGIDIGLTGTVNLTGALPNLSSNLAIEGPGADEFTVRRDSGGDYRIFTVTSGSVVFISGITITNGETPEGFDTGDDDGGGISNTDNGTLTVTGSTITNNTASRNGDGGGIYNAGTLTVTDSTITNNTAGINGAGAGGGIFCNTNIGGGGPTTITNSTMSGNTAGSFGGGGVFNFDGYTLIEFSTITNNTAASAGRGSGVASLGESLTTEVVSSIISANTNTDVDYVSGQTNTFFSSGYNLIGDGNAIWAFNQTGDQIDHFGVINPGLGALADNGGPTQTHALLSGSPAIDAVPQGTNNCGTDITQDQRGVSRPQGSACDIGSFELEKPDREAPKVISTFPRNGGEVGPAANIRATFSEDMRINTIDGSTFKLFRKGSTSQIGAAVTYDVTTHIATLNPTNNLRRGVAYKAVVSTWARDVAGNRLDQNSSTAGLQQKVWFFEIDD